MDVVENRCVLIVDDDPSIRLLLVTVLRRRGFRVREARDGREALAQMRLGTVDLAIMDLMMPEVSGWDVLRERAADPSLQQTPMIVVTATNIRDMMGASQVYAVVQKPFDLDVLLKTVTACLGDPHAETPLAA